MPKISLAVMENRVREFDGTLQRSTYKKVAKLAVRRFESFTHEPTEQECLELFRTITYTDPVGDEATACLDGHKACRNHEDHTPFHPNAARRLGVAA